MHDGGEAVNWVESQIDRIVGPTHHFGGLGVGNVASQSHLGQPSNPAAAALQGLDKMRRVATLGVPQLILPPQKRPNLAFLRSLGFQGSDGEVLRRARYEVSGTSLGSDELFGDVDRQRRDSHPRVR